MNSPSKPFTWSDHLFFPPALSTWTARQHWSPALSTCTAHLNCPSKLFTWTDLRHWSPDLITSVHLHCSLSWAMPIYYVRIYCLLSLSAALSNCKAHFLFFLFPTALSIFLFTYLHCPCACSCTVSTIRFYLHQWLQWKLTSVFLFQFSSCALFSPTFLYLSRYYAKLAHVYIQYLLFYFMYCTYCGFGSESAWTGIDFGRLDPDRNYVSKNDPHKKENGEKMYCF